jgi:hypothetical protein
MINPTVTAQFAVVPYGPVELEGFLMPSGEFRQSLNSTARALGMRRTSENFRLTMRNIAGAQANAGGDCNLSDSALKPARGIIEVGTGISGIASTAQTIDLQTVVAFWGHVARANGKYSNRALDLLQIGTQVSLEGVYREAFGIQDSRSIQDQLLDAWLDLDRLKRRPIFDQQFCQNIMRVTGQNFYGKNPNMAVVISELVWHRIPEPVLAQMKELNPVTKAIFTKPDGTEVGYRRYAYTQLLSDDAFRDAVLPIATAAKAMCAAAPDKIDGGYPWVLRQLDKTFPRTVKRGKASKTAGNGQLDLAVD